MLDDKLLDGCQFCAVAKIGRNTHFSNPAGEVPVQNNMEKENKKPDIVKRTPCITRSNKRSQTHGVKKSTLRATYTATESETRFDTLRTSRQPGNTLTTIPEEMLSSDFSPLPSPPAHQEANQSAPLTTKPAEARDIAFTAVMHPSLQYSTAPSSIPDTHLCPSKEDITIWSLGHTTLQSPPEAMKNTSVAGHGLGTLLQKTTFRSKNGQRFSICTKPVAFEETELAYILRHHFGMGLKPNTLKE